MIEINDDETASRILTEAKQATGDEREQMADALITYGEKKAKEEYNQADEHFSNLFLDEKYYNEQVNTPELQQAYEATPFPKEAAKSAVLQAYLQHASGAPVSADTYEFIRDSYAQAKFGKTTVSDEEMFNLVRGEYDWQKQRTAAINDLQMQAVSKAITDSQLGQNRPFVDGMTEVFNQWQGKYPELVDGKNDAAFLSQGYKLYYDTINDLDTVRPQASKALSTLTSFTQGNATDEDMQSLANDFVSAPPEDRQKIYKYVTLAAQAGQIDRAGIEQFAVNMGQAFTRGFDFVPQGTLQMQEAGVNNWLSSIRNGTQIWVPTDGDLTKAVVGNAPAGAESDAWRQATLPETETLIQSGHNVRESFKVVRELRNVAKTGVDPIRPVLEEDTFWGTAERGAYGLAGSIPLMGATAVNPYLGVLAYQATEYDRIMLENPDIDPQFAQGLALVEGAANAAIDRVQLKSLSGKLPMFGRYLDRIKSDGVRRTVKIGANVVEQNLQEGAQDLIAPVLETAVATLREDMPDKDFTSLMDEWAGQRAETFFATLPLALIGGGIATYQDIKNPSAELNATKLRQVGFDKEQTTFIQRAENPEEYTARIQMEWDKRTPENIEAGRQEILNTIAQASTPGENDARISESIAEDGSRRWVVTAPDGRELLQTQDQQAALEAVRQHSEAQMINERNTVADMVDYFRAQDPTNTATIEAPRTVQQELDRLTEAGDSKGIANLNERIRFAGIPEGADLTTYNILGEANVETTAEGVFRGVIKLRENSRPEDAFEEINHVFVRKAIAEGRVDLDSLRGWLTQTSEATGETYATETETEIIENIAKVGMDYAAGRIDETSLPASFVDYIKRMLQVFKEAMARAIKLKDAFATGKIDANFESFLADSVGLNQQSRVDTARERVGGELTQGNFNYSIGSMPEDQRAAATMQAEEATQVAEEVAPVTQFMPAESEMMPSKGEVVFEEGVKDSQGNGQYVDRIYGTEGNIEWDSNEDSFPRIRWSQTIKKGAGKTLYLEALSKVKSLGKKGLKSDPIANEDEGIGGPTPRAIGAQQSLEKRGLITITNAKDGSRLLEITPKGEAFLQTTSRFSRPAPVPGATNYSIEKRTIQPGNLPDNLATVIRSARQLKKQKGFLEAKKGDTAAARAIVLKVLKDSSVEEIKLRLRPNLPVVFLPVVHIDQGSKVNRIPIAYARELANRIGGTVETNIGKITGKANTDAPVSERFQNQQAFDGPVQQNVQYVLVDDTLTSGDTFLSLLEHIQSNQGMVSAITALADGLMNNNLRPKQEFVKKLLDRAGVDKRGFLNEFGFPITQLSGGEVYRLANLDRYWSGVKELKSRILAEGGTGGTQGTGRIREDGDTNYSIASQSEIDRVNRALGGMNRGPDERLKVYERAKQKFSKLMAWNSDELAAMADTGSDDSQIRRTQILQALGELDGILSVLPPEVRGRVGGYTKLAGIAPMDVLKDGVKVSEVSGMKGALISAWMDQGLNIGQAGKQVSLPPGYEATENLSTKRADKAIADFFRDRIKRIDTELEKVLVREYTEAITKAVKQSRPKAGDNGVRKSTLGAETQKFADMVQRATLLDDEATPKRMAEIDAALTNPDATAEDVSALSEEWSILNTFGDLDNRSSETLAQGLDWLKGQLQMGREAWRIKEQARIDEQRARSAATIEWLGKGTAKKRFADKGLMQRIAEVGNNYLLDHASFEQFVTAMLPPEIAANFSERLRKADMAAQASEIRDGKGILDAVRAGAKAANMSAGDAMLWLKGDQKNAVAYLEGRKVKDERIAIELAQKIVTGEADRSKLTDADVETLRNELAALPADTQKEFVTIKRVIFRGEDVKLDMSRAKAMQLLLSWNQPDVQIKMRKEGWTDESAADLNALVNDPVSREVMAYAKELYGKGAGIVNPVYSRMFGMNMPQVKNYAPTRFLNAKDSKDIGLDGSPTATGTTPGFAKSRVTHSAKIAPEDALTVMQGHIAQQAHWVHFAELAREFRALLSSPEVRESLKQTHGEGVLKSAELWADQLEQRGGNKAKEIAWLNPILGTVLSGKAVSSLGFSLKTLAMQLDNTIRFGLALDTKQIVSALSNPSTIVEDIQTVWESDAIQNRLQGGASAEARFLFSRYAGKPNFAAKIAEASMTPINWLDSAATSISSAIVYRANLNDALAAGMPENLAKQAALNAASEAIYRFAQPVSFGQKSIVENNGNVMAKMFFLFMSDARLKTAILADSARGLATGSGDKWTHIRRILAIETMAVLSHVVSNAFRDAFSDDDDEEIWTGGGIAKAILLAPLQGFFFAGTLGELAISKLTGQKTFNSTTQNPLLSSMEQAVRAGNNLEDAFNFDDPDAMLKEWNNIFRSMALSPAMAAPAVLLNMVKPVVGLYQNATTED